MTMDRITCPMCGRKELPLTTTGKIWNHNQDVFDTHVDGAWVRSPKCTASGFTMAEATVGVFQ